MGITGRLRATTRLAALLVALVGVVGGPATSDAQPPIPSEERTQPRLSFVDGQVSFRRPGVEEWTAAKVNTPLAPGDELVADSPGTLEVQIGGQAYARAWAHTQLGVQSLDAESIRLRITAGHAALDLRRLNGGQTVELAAPNAVFTIETTGYYRINVADARTTFTTRRGGRATLALVGGAPTATAKNEPTAIAENEEVVVEGSTAPAIAREAAPAVDAWDQWNTARTDALLTTASSQYVSSDIYGVSDLDHYGTWRVDESYGAVWAPGGLTDDWAPYTNGRWVWDPLYGRTWVESAPWGWAPFHYGRWVSVRGSWVWAPGPRVARPVYAPALVAFFGGGPGVAVGVAGPTVGWVALGWGEPLIPWWGRVGFIGVPWWAGWGGPRVVNNVVVSRTTLVNVTSVKVFRNASVKNAVVAVPRDHFGRTSVTRARARQVDGRGVAPMRGPTGEIPDRPSPVPGSTRGGQPLATGRPSRGMTRDPDDLPRRAITRTAPAVPPTSVGQRPAPGAPAQMVNPTPPMPASAAGPGPAPAASAPAPQRPRAERSPVSPSGVAPTLTPGPRWRRDGAVRDQPAGRPVPRRIEPGGPRRNTPHPTPATRVRPSVTGRHQEGPPSPGGRDAAPAPRHGGSPRR